MAIRCEVCGQYPIKGALRTFFQWPADVNQRVYWRTCLGIQELNIDKPDLYICSDHFEQMQTIRKGTALRKDAFPKRYEGPLPTFPQEDEIPKEELDPPQVKNEEIGIFEEPGPSAPIFDDEEIMPEELSMAKLMHLFAAAAKERPSSIVPLVTPITAETKAFSNILIDRQEKYLDAYCKSCLRQVDVVNMLEANCEGVSVPIMYKTVFMTEIEPSEIPQLMCRACIGLLFQCYKFASMTVKSSEVLRAARERFKYLPAIDDDTIDLKNIPQKYSARSSHKDIAEDEDDKEAVKITSKTVKKRKSPVKSKEAPPEKKGRRTSTRRASVKAKKVSKKILQDSDDEDESNDDNSDNDDADPDFDSVGYEVKDESPDPSDEEDEKEEKEEEQDDNYCMLCRHQFTNMARHMEKVHRVDWESKSCERCSWTSDSVTALFTHIESHIELKCSECSLTFESRQELDRHNKLANCTASVRKRINLKQRKKLEQLKKKAKVRKQETKSFYCTVCKIAYENFKAVFDHLQSDHKDTKDCIICEKSFEKNVALLAHLKSHAPSLYCGHHFLAFKTRNELLKHIKSPGHSRECGICGKTFENRAKRDSHRRSHIIGSKPYKKEIKCPHCPMVFGYSGNLTRHIRSFHEKRVFLCEDCGSSFTTNFDLGAHVSKVHGKGQPVPPKSKPVQCELCGRTFREFGLYKIHKAEHLGHTEICEYCKETFENKEKLNEHIEALDHHVFQCEKCPSKFKNKAHLIKHLLKHDKLKTLKKPLKLGKGTELLYGRKHFSYRKTKDGRFECTVCLKQFSGSSNVVRHFDIHSDVPKYRCQICGKMFKQKPGLKNHLAVHSDERPLACKICGSRFKDTSTLSKHRRSHFKNMPSVDVVVTTSQKWENNQ